MSINKPIPDSVFDFKFRHGIYVDNRIEKTKYKVNENGLRLGESKPMPVFQSAPLPPAIAYTGPTTETREEPARWGWWLLPSTLAASGVSGGWLLARRWRQRRAVGV